MEMIKLEDRIPKEEFKNEQERKDKLEQIQQKNDGDNNNEYEFPKEVIEINQALQTIKILGQIVKNQKVILKRQINWTSRSYIFRELSFS